jgi:hypothetical protein
VFLVFHKHDKAHPLVHGAGLHPSHRQGPPCRSVDLLPMSPVCCVTYVPSLDRFNPSPHPSPNGRGSRSEFAARDVTSCRSRHIFVLS